MGTGTIQLKTCGKKLSGWHRSANTPTCAFGVAAARASAFSLVELLVVIGVIGLLLGLLLPALASARGKARMVKELAASHELIQAYTIYATEHRGRLIPGLINSSSPEYSHLVLTDGFGDPLDAPAADRWPWRLASHIKYGIKGSILINDMEPLADRNNWNTATYPAVDWSYAVSLYPSFGLNLWNLGEGSIQQEGAIKKVSQARQPSRLVVFASARSTSWIPGSYRIKPPAVYEGTTMVHGQPQPTFSAWRPWKSYSNTDSPAYWGYIDPRWDGKAVVACLDGHSELLSLKELCDMTRWNNQAAIDGNPNWQRQTGDPNWVH